MDGNSPECMIFRKANAGLAGTFQSYFAIKKAPDGAIFMLGPEAGFIRLFFKLSGAQHDQGAGVLPGDAGLIQGLFQFRGLGAGVEDDAAGL